MLFRVQRSVLQAHHPGGCLRITNHHAEESVFGIIPLYGNYYVLLGRTALAWYNAVPNRAYGKLKIPSLRDTFTITGRAELHPITGKYTAAEVASCAFLSNLDPTANPLMTHKCRGSIVVLSISKSVEPNEEQKEMISGFQ